MSARRHQLLAAQWTRALRADRRQVGAGYRALGYQPDVRDAYPRSDFGLGCEVIPKIWMDK